LLKELPMLRIFAASRWGMVCCFALASVLVGAGDRGAAVEKGINFLLSSANADGAYSPEAGPGVTALCVTSILVNKPLAVTDPVMKKSLAYLEKHVQPDGGIYAPGSRFQNYETCLSMLALHAANGDGKYDQVLEKAEGFVKGIQWDESESVEPSNNAYGGSGYGKDVKMRPDLSNTSFLVSALKEMGRGADDEAIQRALTFVSRCQNLDTEHNQTEFAAKVNDGGFYYTPAAGGNSQAGPAPGGGLRSYGSMTYAGLMSMIHAGLTKDDPRVVAAMQFISENYSVEENPGMGDSGLFYYYHTFAKAMAAAGEPKLKSADGKEHDWRAEIEASIIAKQAEDGSWINTNNRWLEGDRNLVTAYALMALSYTAQK
jgi:squalene-hopene/tetraprenyl-beta-curcumene cyclase